MSSRKARSAVDLDRSLWFMHLGCRGRHYLLGNPHIVPGRMQAWCPEENRSFFLSKADMGVMSRAAQYWVAGFLHGNEPPPPAGPDGPPDFASHEYRRWRRQLLRYHATGAMPARRPGRGDTGGRTAT